MLHLFFNRILQGIIYQKDLEHFDLVLINNQQFINLMLHLILSQLNIFLNLIDLIVNY